MDVFSKTTKIANLRKSLLKIIKSSTIHGFPNLFISELIHFKVIWFICLLVSISACIVLVIGSIIEYFDYNVKFNVKYLELFDIEFPAVTFCNLNPLDYSKQGLVEDIEKSDYPIKLDKNYLTNLLLFNYTLDDVKDDVITIASGLNAKYNANSYYRSRYGYSIEDMLISCRFNGKPCNKNYFLNNTVKTYGNCYSFNTGQSQSPANGEILKAVKAGQSFGLSLELFVGLPELQPFWVSTVGAVVAIHNKSTKPLMSERGYKLIPGQESNIMFERQEIRRLGYPFSACIENISSRTAYDSFQYWDTFSVAATYSQDLCLQRCVISTPSDPLGNATLISNTIITTRSNISWCLPYCPEECQLIQFYTNPHYALYPTDMYARSLLATNKRFLSLNLTLDQVKRSVVSVNLNYMSATSSLIYETQDLPVSILLANIGGQLGLFLGMSVLSFIEIFELLFTISYHKLKTFILKKRIKQSSPSK